MTELDPPRQPKEVIRTRELPPSQYHNMRVLQSTRPPPTVPAPKTAVQVLAQHHARAETTNQRDSLDVLDFWARDGEINPYHSAHNPGMRPPNHIGFGLPKNRVSPGWIEAQLQGEYQAEPSGWAEPRPEIGKDVLPATRLPASRLPAEMATTDAGQAFEYSWNNKRTGHLAPRTAMERGAHEVMMSIKEAFMRSNGSYGVSDMARLFRVLDKNKEGRLNTVVFMEGMTKYGCRMTRSELASVWDQFSKDETGRPKPVDFTAVRQVICGRLSIECLRMVHRLWTDLDDDCSGYIHCHELMRYYNFAQDPAIRGLNLSPEQARERMFSLLDQNGSGKISEAEFLHFFSHQSPPMASDEAFARFIGGIFLKKR